MGMTSLLIGLTVWAQAGAVATVRETKLVESSPGARAARQVNGESAGASPRSALPQDVPAVVEQIELGGVLYEVPLPWRGKRIALSVDPSALVPLPASHTRDSGIYVTVETREAFVDMASPR